MVKKIVIKPDEKLRAVRRLRRIAYGAPPVELPSGAELIILVRDKRKRPPLDYAVFRSGSDYYLALRVFGLTSPTAALTTKERLTEALAPLGIVLE